jgi:hypothetical protein
MTLTRVQEMVQSEIIMIYWSLVITKGSDWVTDGQVQGEKLEEI